jgi:hypothetical protein
MKKRENAERRTPNAQWGKWEIAACAVAALFLAAIEIVFFTPLVFGGNQR